MMTANTVRFWRLTTLYLKCLLPINPLTTNDTVWCRLTFAACYQLVQSVDGFCTNKKGRMGESGRKHIQDMLCAWQLPWLSVEQPWSALAGPFLTLLAQMGTEVTPLPL